MKIIKVILQRLLRKKDFYAIISFYALSFYIVYVARDFRVIPGVPRAQNPGFYPLLLSGFLIILTTVYLLQTLKKIIGEIDSIDSKEKQTATIENSEAEEESEESFWGKSTVLTRKKLLIAVVMVYLYIYLLDWLGFFSSSFLFLVVMTKVLFAQQRVSNKKIVLLTFAVTVVIFIIFDFLIGIRFPQGILF